MVVPEVLGRNLVSRMPYFGLGDSQFDERTYRDAPPLPSRYPEGMTWRDYADACMVCEDSQAIEDDMCMSCKDLCEEEKETEE